jgi:hypothetical protein
LEVYDHHELTEPAKQTTAQVKEVTVETCTSVPMSEVIIVHLPETEPTITIRNATAVSTYTVFEEIPLRKSHDDIKMQQRHQAQSYPRRQLALQLYHYVFYILYHSSTPENKAIAQLNQPHTFQPRNRKYLKMNVNQGLALALRRFLSCSKFKGPPPEKGPPLQNRK